MAPRPTPVGCEQLPVTDGIFNADKTKTKAPHKANSTKFLRETETFFLIEITPNIKTPAPAGQRQFGSARWMSNTEKKETFSPCIITKGDKLISYLIEHGYDDIEAEEEGDRYF